MSIFALMLFIISESPLKLTPAVVESLLMNVPDNKIKEYEYRIHKSNFQKNALRWLFTPELSLSRSVINDNDATYNENTSLYFSIFSPSRLYSLSQSYFALKQNKISREINESNTFISVIGLLFDYEYMRRKSSYDSLNVEYARKLFTLTQERISLGLADSLDFLKALDNLESVKIVAFEDSVNLKVLENKIKELLGIEGSFTIILDSFIPPKGEGLSPFMSKRIRVIEESKKSARTSLYLSLFSLIPEVGIKYSWDYFGNQFEANIESFNRTKTFQIFLLLNPLDFVSELRSANLRYQKSLWETKNVYIQEKQRFEEYVSTLQILKGKIRVLRNRILLREGSLRLSLEKYTQGELSLQDVLKEQADYMAVISNYLKVKLDIIKLQYNLWHNFGGKK